MPGITPHLMVRLALPSDAAELAELRWLSRAAYEQEAEHLAAFAPRFSSWLTAALGSATWYAAVAQGNTPSLLGCMFLQCVATVPVPGVAWRQWGYVTHAFVRAPHRNRGLGKRMLELLIQQGRELQLHELHVWPSTAAVSLYTRAGFLSPDQQRVGVPPDESSYILPLG